MLKTLLRLQFLLFLFFLSVATFSQSTITGVVKDTSTMQAVPFAAVGISGTTRGTLCDETGIFKISRLHDTDTLKISAIGYNEIIVPVKTIHNTPQTFYLKPEPYTLPEVNVNAKDKVYITLGTAKYSKGICTAFMGENENWKGEQAAILAQNKTGRTVYLETFGFYIIKNEYPDSLKFRLMLYEADANGFPGKTFLKKPILFKTKVKQGEVQVDLKSFYLSTDQDFFISLECLEEKMEGTKFCFAGSVKVPSFIKTSPFGRWLRVRGGGGDFNIKAQYMK